MNTTKQIQVMVALVALLMVGLVAYTVYEPGRQETYAERQAVSQVERGANLFASNCAACHGLSGEGFVGPALNRPENRPSDPAQLKAIQDKFRNTISCGRVGTFMPAWSDQQGGGLNDDQIQQLVLLITTNAGNGWEKAKEHADELKIEPTRPTPDQLNQGACGQVLRATPPPTAATSAVPVEAKAAWDVKMGDNFFDPKDVAVPTGQPVTISLRNTGTAIHNMRIAGPDGRYDTPDDVVSQPATIRGGQDGRIAATFTQAGTFNFRCDFHPVEMTGTITVK